MKSAEYKILVVCAGILICSLFMMPIFAQQPPTITRPAVQYQAADSRDPFQSPFQKKVETAGAAEGASLPSLTVQGLIWGGNFPQAIINNKVVKVGDVIEDAQVINIDKNGVTIMFGEKLYNLSSPASGGEPSSTKP
jgi:hypothetical protein